MTCGDCGQSSCCCGQSISGLRAGIHPDHIKTAHVDLLLRNTSDRTFETVPIVSEPVHIISVTASFMASARNEAATTDAQLRKQIEHPRTGEDATRHMSAPLGFSLMTMPSNWDVGARTRGGWNAHPDSQDGREYICTGAVTAGSPSWKSHDELFGYFCDGGLFVEYNTFSTEVGMRLVVNYMDRAAFSPAYKDPVQTLLHYWNCANPGADFLEGFYTGVSVNYEDDFASSGDSSISTVITGDSSVSSDGTNPLSTDLTSPSFPSTIIT
jgi:hypothetical protein